MKLTLRGLGALKERLRRLERRVEDPRAALSVIGADLIERVEIGFERESDPYGIPWKPLAPATLERRRKRGEGARILQDTGVMRRSLNYRAVGRNAVAVGFADRKAAWHQEGTDRIPARPMLPWRRGPGGLQLPSSWLHGIMTTLEDYYDV